MKRGVLIELSVTMMYPFCTPAWHLQNSVKLACRRGTEEHAFGDDAANCGLFRRQGTAFGDDAGNSDAARQWSSPSAMRRSHVGHPVHISTFSGDR